MLAYPFQNKIQRNFVKFCVIKKKVVLLQHKSVCAQWQLLQLAPSIKGIFGFDSR